MEDWGTNAPSTDKKVDGSFLDGHVFVCLRSWVKKRGKMDDWKTDLQGLNGWNKVGIKKWSDEMRDVNFGFLCQRNRLDNVFLIFSWPRYSHLGLSNILNSRSFLK